MQLIRRDDSSGVILAMVDTGAMTNEERAWVADELHELIVERKCREASRIADQGLEAQLKYLVAECGEDALIDIVLNVLDAADTWRAWK